LGFLFKKKPFFYHFIKRTNVGKNQKLEDYFIELYKLKNERIEQAIIEKKDEEIKECSFHPQINLLFFLISPLKN